MRYFVLCSYLGTAYRGWQWQLNTPNTIQKTLQDALTKVLKHHVYIYGCGRTDTGVHAIRYVAHFDSSVDITAFDIKKINHALPNDIGIIDIIPMHAKAHSRYDARLRSYVYFWHSSPYVHLNQVSTYIPQPISSEENMFAASAQLLSHTDYRNLCYKPDKNKDNICHIKQIKWLVDDSRGRYAVIISADRFLKSMIRLIVYQLLQIGYGYYSSSHLIDILRGDIKIPRVVAALPQGLHLYSVTYDYPVFEEEMTKPTFLLGGLKNVYEKPTLETKLLWR